MNSKQICGCKGVRTCLLCETENSNSLQIHESKTIYKYCSYCNLCWSDGNNAPQRPLYLGGIALFPEFLNAKEEGHIVSSIDRIEWMPSQSGRRKQDFGPKVNFKKKKVKVGEFKGFPTFTKAILSEFQQLEELSNFQAVELCHLEYTPERGSSIDPHVDDFWLWGERLVTVNLQSSTVLSLTPSSTGDCKCAEELERCQFKHFVKVKSKNDLSRSYGHPGLSNKSTLHSEDGIKISNQKRSDKECETHRPILSRMFSKSCHKNCGNVSEGNRTPRVNSNSAVSESVGEIECVCTGRRSSEKLPEIEILIELPSRSLLILSGCSRYNWFHAIKRKDVVSRRLAMTFRELSPEFETGIQKAVGEELLSIASNFLEFGI